MTSNVKKIALAMRFHSNKNVEILFNINKKWFDGQLNAHDHYDEWFDVHAKGCFASNLDVHRAPMETYTYSLEGLGKDLEKFLWEYENVISNVRIVK